MYSDHWKFTDRHMRKLLTWSLLALLTGTVLMGQTQTREVRADRFRFGGTSTTAPILTSGSGAPTAALPPGSIYTNTVNGDVYRRTDTPSWVIVSSGGGGGGSVTSVNVTFPTSIFSFSGGPITTSGTIAASLLTQTANRIFAGPSTGSPAAPAFRALVEADLPSITSSMITDGTITFGDWASNGCASGEIPKWNGSGWACASDAGASAGAPDSAQYLTLATDGTLLNERVLTAGTGISLTDAGAGSTETVALSTPVAVANGGTNLTAAAEDNVMVGNATTWQSKVLPSCSNTTTSKLLYDTATNAFSCGTDQDSGATSTAQLVGITIDAGASTITTGTKGFAVVPITGTIVQATLLSTDASVTSGSIVIDVWKDSYANYPPTVADTITASAKPTISSGIKSQDSTLTGWTTSVTAGDILGFNVDSVTSLKRVTLTLKIQ